MRMPEPFKIGNKFYCRIHVPPHLRDRIVLPSGRRGASVWKVTMGTSDPREAKRLWPRYYGDYQAAVRRAEGVGESEEQVLREKAREYVRENGGNRDGDGDLIWSPERDPATGDWVAPPEKQIPKSLLVRAFGRDVTDESAARTALWEELYADAQQSPTLEDALEARLLIQKPKPNTVLEWRTAVKELGARRLVKHVRQDDVQAYVDRVAAKGLRVGTIVKKVGALRTLFNFAKKRRWCTSNPTADVSLPQENKAAKQARLPFSAEQLQTIFAGPVHTSGARPRAGAGEAAFWLPILGLYTGARLDELGQLATRDVRKEAGVWFIDITDEGEGQSLKTAASRRRVPLHPDIRDAFLAYVGTLKGTNVFPKLRHGEGRKTAAWSKWWARYLDTTIGLNDPRLSFHSFRHTFKGRCWDSEIPERLHDLITGHSANTVGRSYGAGGGEPVSLKKLGEYVARLKIKPVVPAIAKMLRART